MPQMLNWGKLVSQGRAKAPGVSWSDKEAKAVGEICEATGKSMSEVAQYVRKGILTIDAFNKAQEKPGAINPFLKLSKPELIKKAQLLELSVSPDATVEVLAQTILEKKQKDIEEAQAKKKEAEAEKKAEAKAKAEAEAKEKAKAEAEIKAKTEKEEKEKIEAKKKEKETKKTPKVGSKAKAKKK